MPTLPQPLGKQCPTCKGHGVVDAPGSDAHPQEKPCPDCNKGKK